MSVRPRGATVLVALLLATLAAVAAPALASPVSATIRVEGFTSTVIPTTTLATDGRPIVSTCCNNPGPPPVNDIGKAHPFTVPSALTLLADAADANGVAFGCSWSDVYNDCFVDGFPGKFSDFNDYWRLVVNGKDSPTGFAGTALHPGDRIDVIATDFALPEPPLLTVAPTPAAVRSGTTFSVKVTSLDTSGLGTTGPGAGAVVSYGNLQAVAGADGTASFMATGTGFGSLSATLTGATSSQVVTVCSYGADPTICNLPAPATPAPPAAAVSTNAPISTASTTAGDKIAPSSHFSSPIAFKKVKVVKRLVGVTAPDRSDVASVRYALAKRVGTLCSFRRANGSLAPATSCSKQVWLPATGRAFWHVTLSKPLGAGRWRAFSQATDGAGNLESPFESQTSFTVIPCCGGRALRDLPGARRSGGGEARCGVPGSAGSWQRAGGRGRHGDRARLCGGEARGAPDAPAGARPEWNAGARRGREGGARSGGCGRRPPLLRGSRSRRADPRGLRRRGVRRLCVRRLARDHRARRGGRAGATRGPGGAAEAARSRRLWAAADGSGPRRSRHDGDGADGAARRRCSAHGPGSTRSHSLAALAAVSRRGLGGSGRDLDRLELDGARVARPDGGR
jgi:hypothetical protein